MSQVYACFVGHTYITPIPMTNKQGGIGYVY